MPQPNNQTTNRKTETQSNKKEESLIDSQMKNFYNSTKGNWSANTFILKLDYLLDLFYYRFHEFAIRDMLTHDGFKESVGIFGIDSLSFLSDRMFVIMD